MINLREKVFYLIAANSLSFAILVVFFSQQVPRIQYPNEYQVFVHATLSPFPNLSGPRRTVSIHLTKNVVPVILARCVENAIKLSSHLVLPSCVIGATENPDLEYDGPNSVAQGSCVSIVLSGWHDIRWAYPQRCPHSCSRIKNAHTGQALPRGDVRWGTPRTCYRM